MFWARARAHARDPPSQRRSWAGQLGATSGVAQAPQAQAGGHAPLPHSMPRAQCFRSGAAAESTPLRSSTTQDWSTITTLG